MKDIPSRIWKFLTSACAVLGLASIADGFVLWIQLIQHAIQLYQSIFHPFYNYIFSIINYSVPHYLYDLISIFFFLSFNSKSEVVNRFSHLEYCFVFFNNIIYPHEVVDDSLTPKFIWNIADSRLGNVVYITWKITLSIMVVFVTIFLSMLSLAIFALTLPFYTLYSIYPGFKFKLLLDSLPTEESRKQFCETITPRFTLTKGPLPYGPSLLREFLEKNNINKTITKIFHINISDKNHIYKFLARKRYNFLSASKFLNSVKLSTIVLLLLIILNQALNKIISY